jgi:uncharacterized protein YdeI (YjbR/CyaY-like superfamily)
MKLGKTLYVTTRRAWRQWLARHHKSASEIWLVYYRKETGKPRVPYNDAVEEALCYGWIDGQTQRVDGESWAQRFSPRRSTSKLSPMNRERVRRLIAAGSMTQAGLARIAHVFDHKKEAKRALPWTIPADILDRIKRDAAAWKHFQRFPGSYKRIRIGWIDAARHRRDAFETRLRHFLKMTARNKRFGMVR